MHEEMFEEVEEVHQIQAKKSVDKDKEKSLREIMNRTHFNKYELEEYMTDYD
ncbi:hypothetical protein HYY69_00405 [Candidatus Woesearchaeota archaeon]|nr:hypothetical protein [Candidatus Woesearchaeota archaeon]